MVPLDSVGNWIIVRPVSQPVAIRGLLACTVRRQRVEQPEAILNPTIPSSIGEYKMRLKALSLLAAVSLLAACETAPEAGTNTGGGGAATPGTTATTGVRDGSQEQLRAEAGDPTQFALRQT